MARLADRLAAAAAGVAACLAAVGCGNDAGAHPTERAHGSTGEPAAVVARVVSPSCAGLPSTGVTLSRDVEPIFLSACSGEYCHGLAMAAAARAHALLVSQPSLECDDMRLLVAPGDPAHSYVVDKMLDRNMCGGHPMPRGLANRLSPAEIRTVTAWICEGAPDD